MPDTTDKEIDPQEVAEVDKEDVREGFGRGRENRYFVNVIGDQVAAQEEVQGTTEDETKPDCEELDQMTRKFRSCNTSPRDEVRVQQQRLVSMN